VRAEEIIAFMADRKRFVDTASLTVAVFHLYFAGCNGQETATQTISAFTSAGARARVQAFVQAVAVVFGPGGDCDSKRLENLKNPLDVFTSLEGKTSCLALNSCLELLPRSLALILALEVGNGSDVSDDCVCLTVSVGLDEIEKHNLSICKPSLGSLNLKMVRNILHIQSGSASRA
jgi:hypothetical protein